MTDYLLYINQFCTWSKLINRSIGSIEPETSKGTLNILSAGYI